MPCIKDSEIHNDYWGSDHCPISLSIDINKIDLEEFRSYMALGAGVEDYQNLVNHNKLNNRMSDDLDGP